MDLKNLFEELDWNLFQTPRDIQERCYRKKKLLMIKVCRQSLEDCRGCGQAGQGPACHDDDGGEHGGDGDHDDVGGAAGVGKLVKGLPVRFSRWAAWERC